MTRFRVHLCATLWTAGQARRRCALGSYIPPRRHRSPLVRLKAKSPKTHTYIHSWLSVWMSEVHPYPTPPTNAASSVRRARRFLLFTRAHQSVPAEQVDQTWIWVKEQPTRLDLEPKRKACGPHYRDGFARIYRYYTDWDDTSMTLRRLPAKDGCKPDFWVSHTYMYIL